MKDHLEKTYIWTENPNSTVQFCANPRRDNPRLSTFCFPDVFVHQRDCYRALYTNHNLYIVGTRTNHQPITVHITMDNPQPTNPVYNTYVRNDHSVGYLSMHIYIYLYIHKEWPTTKSRHCVSRMVYLYIYIDIVNASPYFPGKRRLAEVLQQRSHGGHGHGHGGGHGHSHDSMDHPGLWGEAARNIQDQWEYVGIILFEIYIYVYIYTYDIQWEI